MDYTFVLIDLKENEIGEVGFYPHVGAVVTVAGSDEKYVVIGSRVDIGYSGKAPSTQYVYVQQERDYLEDIKDYAHTGEL